MDRNTNNLLKTPPNLFLVRKLFKPHSYRPWGQLVALCDTLSCFVWSNGNYNVKITGINELDGLCTFAIPSCFWKCCFTPPSGYDTLCIYRPYAIKYDGAVVLLFSG